MPNPVHLILTPGDADGLRRALSKVHRRHAGHIQARQGKAGHFWQGRFGAVAMDEGHLAAALRTIALNPAPARLVGRALDWRWSSLHAHASLREDGVTALAPVLDRFPRFADRLDALQMPLRQAEAIGRPLGTPAFLAALEAQMRRRLRAPPRGPKPKAGPRQDVELSALSALPPLRKTDC